MIAVQDMQRLVNQYGARMGVAGGNGEVREPAKLKTGIHENKKKEDGMKQSQKLLLTWLIENTGLFHKIEKYISSDDFTEEIYHRVAEIVFAQFADTGTVNPAKIVSMFPNEEEQREIAGLFNARIHKVETKEDKEKALKETVVRIKQNSIDYRLKNMEPTDMAGLQKTVADKRALEELKKVHISLD